MSAHGGALEAVERVLNRGGEADDVLRQVVAILHERLGGFVRISFVEETVLVQARPRATRRRRRRSRSPSRATRRRPRGRRRADGGRSRAARTRRNPRFSVRPRRLGHRRRGLESLTTSERAPTTTHAASGVLARARALPVPLRRGVWAARPSEDVAVFGRAPQLPATPLPFSRCSWFPALVHPLIEVTPSFEGRSLERVIAWSRS